MSRILKRPMFRRGGSTNTGIMSGITDRTNYQLGGIDKERLRGSATAIQSLLNELSPVPKTRLPIGQFGLNIASGMSLTDALRDPLAQFTKADDIRRAQLAKRGQGAVSTALQLELQRLKNQAKGQVRTLSKEEVKSQFPDLPEGTIVQQKPDGEYKFNKPDAASVKKRSELKSTIGLLNNINERYTRLGKPVGGFAGFGFDIDRIKGQVGRLSGSKKGQDYARLVQDIKNTTTFLTQAISGAAVSTEEAKRIQALIPQLDDTEVVFEAKLDSLRRYLADAASNYGGDIEEFMKAGDRGDYNTTDYYKSGEGSSLEIGEDGIYDVTGGQYGCYNCQKFR